MRQVLIPGTPDAMPKPSARCFPQSMIAVIRRRNGVLYLGARMQNSVSSWPSGHPASGARSSFVAVDIRSDLPLSCPHAIPSKLRITQEVRRTPIAPSVRPVKAWRGSVKPQA